VSEAITPANAVQRAESWNFAIWAELGGGIPELVSALVARVKELEQQRDAAVTVLRDARELPDYVDGDIKLWMPDVINDVLKALGAEETT
jgi:hypothetical protein